MIFLFYLPFPEAFSRPAGSRAGPIRLGAGLRSGRQGRKMATAAGAGLRSGRRQPGPEDGPAGRLFSERFSERFIETFRKDPRQAGPGSAPGDDDGSRAGPIHLGPVSGSGSQRRKTATAAGAGAALLLRSPLRQPGRDPLRLPCRDNVRSGHLATTYQLARTHPL